MSESQKLPEIGAIIDVRTTRFGRATVKILGTHGEWVDVEIVKGKLIGMTDEWGPGDSKTLRISHCTFYPKEK